jgi:hypothetical protein
MAAIDRKFYQSWRGPAPADQDSWCLVFDAETRRLFVRHEWQAQGITASTSWRSRNF